MIPIKVPYKKPAEESGTGKGEEFPQGEMGNAKRPANMRKGGRKG
jgi:hypothetical protein